MSRGICRLIMSAMAVLVFGGATALCQDPPNPPCSDPSCTTTWTFQSRVVAIGQYFECPDNPTCLVTVSWWFRPCGDHCEYYLNGVSYIPGNCEITCSFEKLIKGSILAMLDPPPAPCDPGPGNCVTTTKVATAHCWKAYYDAEGYEIAIGVCPNVSTCCTATYRVCRDGNSNLTVTPLGVTSPNMYSCSPASVVVQRSDCRVVCQYMEW